MNIEEVFHYAYLDIEVHRLRQHLEPVGRNDGPGTAWNTGESISAWLSYLEEALRDVISASDDRADLETIVRWADGVNAEDSVVTFRIDHSWLGSIGPVSVSRADSRELRRPLIVDAPTVRKEIRQIRRRALRRPQVLSVALVIQSAWEDGLGNVGVFAVNTQPNAVTVRVRVPQPGRWHAAFYTGSAREEQHDAGAGDALSWRLSPARLEAVVFQRWD